MLSGRRQLTVFSAWLLLLVASMPLANHDCHGVVGALAHSPFYAFVALTASLCVAGLASVVRLSAAPAGKQERAGS